MHCSLIRQGVQKEWWVGETGISRSEFGFGYQAGAMRRVSSTRCRTDVEQRKQLLNDDDFVTIWWIDTLSTAIFSRT